MVKNHTFKRLNGLVVTNPVTQKLVKFQSLPALTDSETLVEVVECLAENFKIETQGACDQKTLFNILVRAASARDSIENTAKTLLSVPCGNDVRYHLDKINNFEELEEQLNLALKSRIPLGLKNRQHCVAIDLNLIPYYGNPSEAELISCG